VSAASDGPVDLEAFMNPNSCLHRIHLPFIIDFHPIAFIGSSRVHFTPRKARPLFTFTPRKVKP
jgi:hypothetical protein